MPDITTDEWQEWLAMPQTKSLKAQMAAMRDTRLNGYAQMPREKWVSTLDEVSGIGQALDLLNSIHKEGN